MSIDDYAFEAVLAAVCDVLTTTVRPCVDNMQAQEELDRACLLLTRIAELIDSAAAELWEENVRIEAFIHPASPEKAVGSEEIGSSMEKGALTISTLNERNKQLRAAFFLLLSSATPADRMDSERFALGRTLAAKMVSGRRPPEYIRAL